MIWNRILKWFCICNWHFHGTLKVCFIFWNLYCTPQANYIAQTVSVDQFQCIMKVSLLHHLSKSCPFSFFHRVCCMFWPNWLSSLGSSNEGKVRVVNKRPTWDRGRPFRAIMRPMHPCPMLVWESDSDWRQPRRTNLLGIYKCRLRKERNIGKYIQHILWNIF